MEQTPIVVPAIHTPKLIKGIMIFFITVGIIFVILGLYEKQYSSIASFLIWLVLVPLYVLRNLSLKSIKGYRAIGITAIIVVLVAASEFAVSFPMLVISELVIFIILIILWVTAFVSINTAFKRAFPGKKLLSRD